MKLTDLEQRAKDAKRVLACDPATITALCADLRACHAALKDAQGGLDYIRQFHGDLYGVGFDRCEKNTALVMQNLKRWGI